MPFLAITRRLAQRAVPQRWTHLVVRTLSGLIRNSYLRDGTHESGVYSQGLTDLERESVVVFGLH